MSSLTFFYHSASYSELCGVIGCSFTLGLPGFFSSCNQVFPLFNGHLTLVVICHSLLFGGNRERDVFKKLLKIAKDWLNISTATCRGKGAGDQVTEVTDTA